MQRSTVTIKGQVTVPIAVRRKLGLAPGSRVEFAENAVGETILRAAPANAAAERDARRADALARLERVRRMNLQLDMPTDEFMAQIREPVPL